jgi:hypothetical protein
MWLITASVHTNGAGGIFFIAGKADIQPASQRSYGWFDGQSTQADLCPVQV